MPAALIARTVNAYVRPLTSPEIVQVRAPVVVQDFAVGELVTEYLVIGLPCVADAVHEMMAVPLPPRAAVTPVGASGSIAAT